MSRGSKPEFGVWWSIKQCNSEVRAGITTINVIVLVNGNNKKFTIRCALEQYSMCKHVIYIN